MINTILRLVDYKLHWKKGAMQNQRGFVLAMKLKNGFVHGTKPKKVPNSFQFSEPFVGFVGNLRNLQKRFLDR